MEAKEKSNVWLNRIVSLLIGGALVFFIVSAAVVNPLRQKSTALSAQLDQIQNGAARLLTEAKAFNEAKDYPSALKSLDTLLAQQPASDQAVEGKKLYASIQQTAKQKDLKWVAAEAAVRSAWEKKTEKEIRAGQEKDLAGTLATKWEESKASVRQDWESGSI